MSFKKEIIGDCTLYLGDCLEVMPTLDKVDAVVTDPPYGIGEGSKNFKSRGKLASADKYKQKNWDDTTADAAVELARRRATNSIIFGGNYYKLPPSRCWLIWDKEVPNNDFADCELAWTNLNKAVRRINYLWHGFIRKERNVKRVHPTQKPVGVMEWCITHLPKNAQTILDPFMGSGTTAVACVNLGRKFIGIEIDPEYFEIACERIKEAYKQPRLFDDKPVEEDAEQAGLL